MSTNQYVEVAIAAKWFLKSKTLWLNAITIGAFVLGLVLTNAGVLELDQKTQVIIGIVIGTLNAIGNMILRATPENVPIAATRGQYQIAYLPKAELTRPPERPATGPQRGKE